MACGCAEYRRSRKTSIFDDFENFGKIGFWTFLGVSGDAGRCGILSFLGFGRFGDFLKFLIFGFFFGFWGVVWKFWREALGLSWEFLIGCKDSSGLIGFDYDGLHFFTVFFCFWRGPTSKKNHFFSFVG